MAVTAHGKSIYGTRGGPVSPRPWGVTTRRGKTVYVHLLHQHDGRVFLPMTAAVASARMFDTGAPARFTASAEGVELTGLPPLGDQWDEIVEMRLR